MPFFGYKEYILPGTQPVEQTRGHLLFLAAETTGDTRKNIIHCEGVPPASPGTTDVRGGLGAEELGQGPEVEGTT